MMNETTMATPGTSTTERSKSLHNFTLPCNLRWGNQRFLRCMKVNNPNSSDHRRPETRRRFIHDDDDGIAAVDLQAAAHNMKNAIFNDGRKVLTSSPEPAEISRPWNLRTRRAPAGSAGDGKGFKVDVTRPNLVISQNKVGPAVSGEKRKERSKFSVPLSKSEIEEDFFAMVGHRPPRRPKKRPRSIQKQIDMVFPGYGLGEVSADMYKVVEPAP